MSAEFLSHCAEPISSTH